MFVQDLLVGQLVKRIYHPKISVNWLTKSAWETLFNNDYDYMTIHDKSAINYYTEETNKSQFLIFFTTEVNENYLLMGAMCTLITPDMNELPQGAYMGKSLIIDSLLNFGRLNEFIEEYDITFDEQTMESDILELSNNKEFEDLNDYIKLARNHKYSTGYIGHYENYSIFLQGLRIKFKKGEYL